MMINKQIVKSLFVLQCLIYSIVINAQSSSIDEFNQTYPLSPELVDALNLVESIIPESDNALREFKKHSALNLELRAFSCAQLVPQNENESNKSLSKSDRLDECLRQLDEQMLDFAGMSLVRFRSMQGPLRPFLKLGKPFLIPDYESPRVYQGFAASKSSVAVLRYDRGENASYEIPGGNKIADLPTIPIAGVHQYVISPNGRITAINHSGITFIDNETGAVLWHAKKLSNFYAWFPEVKAALAGRNSEKILLDFKSGKIVPYSISIAGMPWTIQVSEKPSRYLIGNDAHFSLIENTRAKDGVISKVVKDYKLVKSRVSSGKPFLMDNARAIFFRSHISPENDHFVLFDLVKNEEKLFKTGFLSKTEFAKLSEHDVLGLSFDKGYSGQFPKPWAFNIKNQTLSPIEDVGEFWGLLSGLGERKGFMLRHNGMLIGDELKIGEPSQYEFLVNNYIFEKELSELERKISNNIHNSYSMGQKSFVDLTEFESELAQKRQNLVGKIPADARLELLEWHDGPNADRSGTFPVINVTVEHTNEPIVLLLSSESSHRWNIIKKPGAKLISVIVYSYQGSIVSGLTETKVINRTGVGAWPSSKTDIYNEVLALTGKSINKVQHSYGGNSFAVSNK